MHQSACGVVSQREMVNMGMVSLSLVMRLFTSVVFLVPTETPCFFELQHQPPKPRQVSSCPSQLLHDAWSHFNSHCSGMYLGTMQFYPFYSSQWYIEVLTNRLLISASCGLHNHASPRGLQRGVCVIERSVFIISL